MSHALDANVVLHKLALALPKNLHQDLIVVGSLAAAAQLVHDSSTELRTKDVDGMLAPNARAAVAASELAVALMDKGWEPRVDKEKYVFPAGSTTPAEKLPVIRLLPPDSRHTEWFLELLGAPPALAPDKSGSVRYSNRVQTSKSDFEIPSFAYLGVTQFRPVRHESGLQLAAVPMMALSNLLHHPGISDQVMSEMVASRKIKRSNKDLGRVIAMAFLADELNEDSVEQWPELWRTALQELSAPAETQAKLSTVNRGIHALRNSHDDQNEALHSINNGLLSSRPLNDRQFAIAIQRYLQQTS